MGHAIQILTFDEKMDKKKIQARCDEWGDRNCSLEERGCYDGKLGEFTSGRFGGLGSSVKFTDRLFDNYEDAEEYLMTTTGWYRQTAVRYKSYPKVKPNKAISDLESRIMEYRRKIEVLNQPHYMGVKQATVKCKVAVLPSLHAFVARPLRTIALCVVWNSDRSQCLTSWESTKQL